MNPNETNLEPQSPPIQHRENFFREIVKFSAIALLIVLPIRFFVAQPFIVSGASMQPTFQNGEYLIIDELSYHFDQPRRGEVVIFRYPKDPSKFYIKRIIGLPGDSVEMRGTKIIVRNKELPSGFILNEPYLTPALGREDFLTIELGDGEYFVLGDNRGQSSDSRIWGTLPEKDITGRALIRLLPLNKIELLPGNASSLSPL